MPKNSDFLTGEFTPDLGLKTYGSLNICGEKSQLTLYDDDTLPSNNEAYSRITGELHEDGRKVTLINCNVMGTSASHTEGGKGKKCSAKIFPHYVTIGSHHIPDSEACISEFSFAMLDASSIFYDTGAFSSVSNPKPFVELLTKENSGGREVEFGEYPIIEYFTGKFEIITAETNIGKISANHSTAQTSPSVHGFKLENKVLITVETPQPITFQAFLKNLETLLRFFELIIGREQPLSELSVRLSHQEKTSTPIKVFRSFSPELREPDDNNSSHHPWNVLLCIIDDAERYKFVLKNYLDTELDRHDGRCRLRNTLRKSHEYTLDRIVAGANSFDIFPDSSYPKKQELQDDLKEAKQKARSIFRQLPQSTERDGILGALGRIGSLTLKHKARFRATSTELDKHFPQLLEVLDEAVNCRNHYVHGSPGTVDYNENFTLVYFLTNALEFVFGISDLIDCGWDYSVWKQRSKTYAHPFALFALSYQSELEHFNKIIGLHKKGEELSK